MLEDSPHVIVRDAGEGGLKVEESEGSLRVTGKRVAGGRVQIRDYTRDVAFLKGTPFVKKTTLGGAKETRVV